MFVFSPFHSKKKKVTVQYFVLAEFMLLALVFVFVLFFFFNLKSKHSTMHLHSKKGRLQKCTLVHRLWRFPTAFNSCSSLNILKMLLAESYDQKTKAVNYNLQGLKFKC